MKRLSISLSLLVLIGLGLLIATRSNPDAQMLSQAQFVAMVQSNSLTNVRVYYTPEPKQVDGVPILLHEVRGTFYRTDAASQISKGHTIPKQIPFVARVHLTEELEKRIMAGTNVSVVTPNPVIKKVSDRFHRSN